MVQIFVFFKCHKFHLRLMNGLLANWKKIKIVKVGLPHLLREEREAEPPEFLVVCTTRRLQKEDVIPPSYSRTNSRCLNLMFSAATLSKPLFHIFF